MLGNIITKVIYFDSNKAEMARLGGLVQVEGKHRAMQPVMYMPDKKYNSISLALVLGGARRPVLMSVIH